VEEEGRVGEILALRHFEELYNGEAAEVLGLSKTATSNRYSRALGRIANHSYRAYTLGREPHDSGRYWKLHRFKVAG
jgi:hypothetical protein